MMEKTALSSSVQFSSVAQSCPTLCDPWTAARQTSLSKTNSWSLLKHMSIELVMPCNHLILCCPLLLLPSIFPSIRVFSSESALCIRWPKYCSFSFNIRPSNEHPGLIYFRMDWKDLLAVQRTLKSLLQHHSSKVSFLLCSAFFIVQLSHPNMPTGKTIALTRWTFVGKVMSLLFNMLSRLVITFLPISKCLNFMAAITICSDFGAQQNKALSADQLLQFQGLSLSSPTTPSQILWPLQTFLQVCRITKSSQIKISASQAENHLSSWQWKNKRISYYSL